MAHIPEIPASAYTPETETLGVILDIPVFEGDRIPVSRNTLTSGTRPLQFLPAPGSDFPVDLSKARAGGSSTDASAFWDLLDPPMQSRVIAAGFGDYASGLRRTQPQFPPAMCYALMERWNDCTHSFIFDFGELTLTPADYTAITVLGFDGDAVPLDARYQTIALGAELGDAWTSYAPRVRAEALTPSRVLLQGYWLDRYYLGERFLETHTITAQRRVPVAPPRHMRTLAGMTPEDILLEYGGFPANDYLEPGNYASYLTTRLRTRLPDVREYSQDKKRHRTPAFYRMQEEADVPAGPTGVVLGDVPFPPGMEVALDPALGLGPTLAIPADIRQVPPQLQLDPEHATHVPAQRYQELYQRFYFARAYIARLYPEHHETELEIDRLRRHQTPPGAAISHLQMENDRLHTRLQVEGIPLDSSDEEEEDDDDSSSDDAPPLPPSSVKQAVAGPSRMRR
ncbi:hypothetical protein JCGZ_11029 [Jatropha curcas]|uniref:Aminotransferase-like plant mobile domain-containing protein n=1 Tax=Jatropha curcas TaxID=180498 RepID=A0A067KG14_JATCU|nr:hypothetical protein JCGZ_11029 [Jatropha curcas]